MARKSAAPQKTKKDLVVEILRDAILSGELEPGARLIQEDLAERFQVSPTPIREAIQQLVAEGVLSHSPYKGVQVAEVRLEDMREIYLIRSVVEALATRQAVPNLRIADVKRLRELQASIADAVDKDELAALRKLNYEFHMLIYETANMPQLLHLIKTLWAKSPWDTLFVLPNRPSMVVDEHRPIIAAVEQGDADLAGQAMQAHIEHGLAVLSQFLSNQQQDGTIKS